MKCGWEFLNVLIEHICLQVTAERPEINTGKETGWRSKIISPMDIMTMWENKRNMGLSVTSMRGLRPVSRSSAWAAVGVTV